MITPTPEFWKVFIATAGACSCCEAAALYSIVSKAEQGDFLELGSHRGRSSICIAASMPSISRLILVEPEFRDPNWSQEVLLRVSKWMLPTNILEGFGGYSLDVIPLYSELSFCLIDSGVHDDMVLEECKLLENRMMKGGIIAFHDYKNQFTAVERAYNYLLSTLKYEPIGIDWSAIFEYVKENNLQDGEKSWHVYPDLPHPPNFVGAVRRK